MNLQLVPFAHGDILTVSNGEDVHVVMPPIVDSIGLDWRSQRQRIDRHPLMAEGVCIIHVPSAGGLQAMTALTLEAFHTFLVTLHPDRITDPEVRERVLGYQRRAFRAVFEHFHGPMRVAPIKPAPVSELLRVGNALKKERHPRIRADLWTRYDQITASWGIPQGPHTGIGHADRDEAELLGEFWRAVEGLEECGFTVNHSRKNSLIALNLPELRRLFEETGVPLEIDSDLRKALRQSTSPAFVADKLVNSPDNKSRHCWVFSRAPLLDAIVQQ